MGDSSGGRERERGEWERERELLLLAEAKVGFYRGPLSQVGWTFWFGCEQSSKGFNER